MARFFCFKRALSGVLDHVSRYFVWRIGRHAGSEQPVRRPINVTRSPSGGSNPRPTSLYSGARPARAAFRGLKSRGVPRPAPRPPAIPGGGRVASEASGNERPLQRQGRGCSRHPAPALPLGRGRPNAEKRSASSRLESSKTGENGSRASDRCRPYGWESRERDRPLFRNSLPPPARFSA